MGRGGAWLELPLIWAPSPGIGGASCNYLRPPGAKGKDLRTWGGCGGRMAGWGPGRAGVPPQAPEAVCWLALWGQGSGEEGRPSRLWLRRLSSRWMGEVIHHCQDREFEDLCPAWSSGKGAPGRELFPEHQGRGLGKPRCGSAACGLPEQPMRGVRPGGGYTPGHVLRPPYLGGGRHV